MNELNYEKTKTWNRFTYKQNLIYKLPAPIFSGFPAVLSYFSRLLFLLFGFFLSKFRYFHISTVYLPLCCSHGWFCVFLLLLTASKWYSSTFQFLQQPVVEVEWIFKHQGEIFSFLCLSVLIFFSFFTLLLI